MMAKKRVTGVGGIFFKTKDPKETKSWYQRHLGFDTDQWGATFAFRTEEEPEKPAYLQWSPFAQDTTYFEPSPKSYMINYRVEDLVWLVGKLKEEGVTILDEIEEYPYGKFVHILDNEGNKIELWEAIDDKLLPEE